jgi:aspartate/methionine/tyrosine aminotransferase
MNNQRTSANSPYMEFAKLRSGAKYALSASGVASYSLAGLPVRLEDLEINGPTVYGYAPLQELLARRNAVPIDSVVAAAGTSMANHLAMAACFEPGEEVLIEQPTYELLISTARYLGAEVRRFPRTFENRFQIDIDQVARNISKRTRLIVITNLHNPSGALTEIDTLRELGDLARSAGARVLVDEVYLEALFNDRPPSAFHLGEHFVVTSSLTKAYGLSGLRCGWILAEPSLARRIWRINDLYAATPAHPAELLSVIALNNLQKIATRARELLEINHRHLAEFLDSRSDLECVRPQHGTVAFPRLQSGDVDLLFELLQKKYDTSIVPGRYFEMPQHFRVGICNPEEITAEGLKRLGKALDEIASH